MLLGFISLLLTMF
jgi:mlo protein